eukprot:scaffold28177_cov55-Phaeocystis_antarctica.AAC.2
MAKTKILRPSCRARTSHFSPLLPHDTVKKQSCSKISPNPLPARVETDTQLVLVYDAQRFRSVQQSWGRRWSLHHDMALRQCLRQCRAEADAVLKLLSQHLGLRLGGLVHLGDQGAGGLGHRKHAGELREHAGRVGGQLVKVQVQVRPPLRHVGVLGEVGRGAGDLELVAVPPVQPEPLALHVADGGLVGPRVPRHLEHAVVRVDGILLEVLAVDLDAHRLEAEDVPLGRADLHVEHGLAVGLDRELVEPLVAALHARAEGGALHDVGAATGLLPREQRRHGVLLSQPELEPRVAVVEDGVAADAHWVRRRRRRGWRRQRRRRRRVAGRQVGRVVEASELEVAPAPVGGAVARLDTAVRVAVRIDEGVAVGIRGRRWHGEVGVERQLRLVERVAAVARMLASLVAGVRVCGLLLVARLQVPGLPRLLAVAGRHVGKVEALARRVHQLHLHERVHGQLGRALGALRVVGHQAVTLRPEGDLVLAGAVVDVTVEGLALLPRHRVPVLVDGVRLVRHRVPRRRAVERDLAARAAELDSLRSLHADGGRHVDVEDLDARLLHLDRVLVLILEAEVDGLRALIAHVELQQAAQRRARLPSVEEVAQPATRELVGTAARLLHPLRVLRPRGVVLARRLDHQAHALGHGGHLDVFDPDDLVRLGGRHGARLVQAGLLGVVRAAAHVVLDELGGLELHDLVLARFHRLGRAANLASTAHIALIALAPYAAQTLEGRARRDAHVQVHVSADQRTLAGAWQGLAVPNLTAVDGNILQLLAGGVGGGFGGSGFGRCFVGSFGGGFGGIQCVLFLLRVLQSRPGRGRGVLCQLRPVRALVLVWGPALRREARRCSQLGTNSLLLALEVDLDQLVRRVLGHKFAH